MKVRAGRSLLDDRLLKVLDQVSAELIGGLHAREDKAGLQGPQGQSRNAEFRQEAAKMRPAISDRPPDGRDKISTEFVLDKVPESQLRRQSQESSPKTAQPVAQPRVGRGIWERVVISRLVVQQVKDAWSSRGHSLPWRGGIRISERRIAPLRGAARQALRGARHGGRPTRLRDQSSRLPQLRTGGARPRSRSRGNRAGGSRRSPVQ